MSKGKAKAESLFGINDCHLPKKNTKKSYRFNLVNRTHIRKTRTVKIKRNSKHVYPYILFPSALGQSRPGVELAPTFLQKYILKRHKGVNAAAATSIVTVPDTGDLYQNLNALYGANKQLGHKAARVNIGGDHSMSIATIASTLADYPTAKVVYFKKVATKDIFVCRHRYADRGGGGGDGGWRSRSKRPRR